MKPSRSILPKKPNFDSLQPYFGWTTTDRVKALLRILTIGFMHLDSFLCVTTTKPDFLLPDTFISDIPAHDDGIPGNGGCTMAQIHTGITSHFTKVYPMSSESQILDTFCDLLRDRGAPNKIKSDCAKAQQSNAFKEILFHYHIGQYFLSLTRRTKTQLNAAFKMSKKMSTLSWIGQSHHLNLAPMYLVCGLLVQCSSC